MFEIARCADLNVVRRYCPGTAQYRRRYRKRITAAARKRRQRLVVLQQMHLDGDRILGTQLRHYENQLAAIEIWDGTIAIVFAFVCLAFMALLLPATVHLNLSPPPLHVRHPEMSWSLEWAAGIATFGLLFLCIGLALFASRVGRMSEYLRSIPGWGHLFLIVIATCLLILIYPKGPRADEFRGLLRTLGFFGFFLLPILILIMTLALLCLRRRRTICPDAVASDNLLQVLIVLKSADGWRDLAKRSELLKHLEGAATCIEFGLPRRLQAGDPVSDLWLQQRAHHIAAALRELKQWAAMPKADTRTILMDRVKADLVSIATGNWDRLPGADPKKLSTRIRVLVLVRDVALALLPIGGLLLLYKWNPTILAPATLTWFFTACFLWAVFRLSAILDPRLSTTDVFKSFLDLVPWGRPKG
jgi:hypothetical protein